MWITETGGSVPARAINSITDSYMALTLNLLISWVALAMVIASVPLIIYLLYKIYKSYTLSKGAEYMAEEPAEEGAGFFARLRVIFHSSKIKRIGADLAALRESAERLANRAKEKGVVDVYQKARKIRDEVLRIMQLSDIEVLNRYNEIVDFIGTARIEINNGEAELNEIEKKLSRYDELRKTAHEKILEIVGMIEQLVSGGLIIGGE